MNLANTFARIKKAFTPKIRKEVRVIELSEHMKRDMGLYNGSSDRRVHEKPIATETFIVMGTLTRAP